MPKPPSRATYEQGVICGHCGGPVQDDFWFLTNEGQWCVTCADGDPATRMERHDAAHRDDPIPGCCICQEKGWESTWREKYQ